MRELVTEVGAIMLREMLADPKQPYYVTGLSEAIGRSGPACREQLAKLEELGWVTSEVAARGSNAPRRNYRFTPDGIKRARAEVATWEFTDA